MLHQQVVAAIGKVVRPRDFNDYLTFHHHRLFLPAYRPEVRRRSPPLPAEPAAARRARHCLPSPPLPAPRLLETAAGAKPRAVFSSCLLLLHRHYTRADVRG